MRAGCPRSQEFSLLEALERVGFAVVGLEDRQQLGDREQILDLLREGPRTTTEIVDAFPHLTRFGVMKHIDVLRSAALIHTREEGRQRVNSLNAVPIRQIYERWVSRYQEFWTDSLLRLKEDVESGRKE